MNATREEWRPVVGWESSYMVSSLGRVKSLSRVVQQPNRWGTTTTRRIPERILVPGLHRRGHHRYILHAEGRKEYVQGHRLVLEAFVGPCPDGMECCHNDSDPGNNRVENLRWDTRSSNTLDAVARRTNSQARKTHCPQGHLYDGVERRKNGWARVCLRCRKEQSQRRRR